MKSWILKLFSGTNIKLGVAYALRVVGTTLAALNAITNSAFLADETRRQLSAIVVVLAAVQDFMQRLAEIIGAPALPLASSEFIADAEAAAKMLNKVTDSL